MFYIMQCSKDLPTPDTFPLIDTYNQPILMAVKKKYDDVQKFIREHACAHLFHWMIIEGRDYDLQSDIKVDVKILDEPTRKINDYIEPKGETK